MESNHCILQKLSKTLCKTMKSTLCPWWGSLVSLFMMWKARWVVAQDAGTGKMQEISAAIADGALAFWRLNGGCSSSRSGCIRFVSMVGYTGRKFTLVDCVAFIIGAFTSAFAGYIGMNIATKQMYAQHRRHVPVWNKPLKVAFTGELSWAWVLPVWQ